MVGNYNTSCGRYDNRFFGSLYAAEKLSAKWGRLGIIWFILFVYIGTFIQINIHEFGHYIFGKILGYKLMSYRIGIFTWNYENGKMKFSIIKNNGYADYVLCFTAARG